MVTSVVRNQFGRIVVALAVTVGLLVIVVLLLRAGPGERLEAIVEVRHRCSVTDGYMTATGTVRNRLSEPSSVRLVWTATSSANFDPPIERGYTVNLNADEEVEFEHLIVSADSIGDNIVVDDDYDCRLTVAPHSN